MKSLTFLSAALAATALPLPAFAAPVDQVATAEDTVRLHDHIRTTLYGDSGPVVVLIPGMSTPDEVWDDAVAHLSPYHRVLTVEVRGFDGERGTANEREGAIPGIVADLSADLAARGLGPANIVGHSLGGLLAMQFALDHPDQASRLLIVDSLPFFGMVFAPDMTLERVEGQATQMRDMLIAGAETMRAAGEKGVTQGGGAAGMSVVEETQVKIANWSLDAEPLAVAQLVYEDMTTDLRDEIAAIDLPVTVIHMANGDYAEMAKTRYSTDYAKLPGVKLVPVNGTGHFVQLDRADIFRAELALLLSR